MKHKLAEGGKDRLSDMAKFGYHMMLSRDIDPLYHIIDDLIIQEQLDEEQAYWLCFLYVAWYNLPVAWRAFHDFPEPGNRIVKKLDPSWPTGIERRANRGGKVGIHISSYLKAIEHTAQIDWYHRSLPHAGSVMELSPAQLHENWQALNHQLQTLWGNGRWAAYKHLEVLRRVMGVPVMAPDMGHQFSSGPREGLSMFYGAVDGQKAEVIELLDSQGEDLQRRLSKRGLRADIEEVETLLCNWKSLMKGKYYVGHDIDENQEQISVAKEKGIISGKQHDELFFARYRSLPHHYLGEMGPLGDGVAGTWHGVDKERMKAYQRTGKIVVRFDMSEMSSP